MYDTPTDVTTSNIERPRRSTRILSGILGAALLFASGLGIGWLVSSEPAATVEPIAQGVVATSTSTAPASIERAETPSPPVVTAPLIVPGEEPIADIAQAVLPAMVQIKVLDQTGLQSGVGSGVIYDPNGHILTAAHVVDDAFGVQVRLNDGTELEAEVVGADAANDIAVVAVDRTNLPAAALALGEELRAGQLAIAVGSPWGLDSTVTAGIVSAVNRPLASQVGPFFVNMIQTDASINPGNSGGALVDRQGKVIGINVSIYSSSGANDGVGFAVPIDRAYRVATALTSGGQFVPGRLGVMGQAAEVNETPGAVITEVVSGSAAADAGLEVNDVVVSINGEPVAGIEDLAAQVRSYEAGETVVLEVIRDGETLELGATLGASE